MYGSTISVKPHWSAIWSNKMPGIGIHIFWLQFWKALPLLFKLRINQDDTMTGCFCFHLFNMTNTPQKINIAPENRPKPKRKPDRLPTIIFQGRAVNLRGCILLLNKPTLSQKLHHLVSPWPGILYWLLWPNMASMDVLLPIWVVLVEPWLRAMSACHGEDWFDGLSG